MKPKIVILEHDQDTLDIMTIILEEEGYEVFGYVGVKSVDQIFENKPLAVLLDIRLGHQPGAEIAEALRKDTRGQNIRIALISAADKLDQIAAACGVDTFIPKPFDIGDLITKVRQLLSAPLDVS